MRGMENDLTLGDSPPPDKSPSGNSIKRKTVIIAVVVVVAVVVIASAFVLDEHMVATHVGHPHTGILSLSEISKLAGQPLTMYWVNTSQNTSQLKLNIISAEEVAFNTSNHTSSLESSAPGVLVISYEFTNQTESSHFYNISYMVVKQFFSARNYSIDLGNISYDGFTFFMAISNYSGLYVVSSGYSGNYGFTIVDINVSLSNYTALVYDEIQAMTS